MLKFAEVAGVSITLIASILGVAYLVAEVLAR